MKIGVSLLGLAQQPRGEDMRKRLDEIVVWVNAVRDAGFDYLTTGQHYLPDPLVSLQPVPLLARLAPESGDMGMVATLIAPLHNPVDLAETWATLDLVTGGRTTICFALGYRDVEYAAFGVDRRRRVAELRAVVETMRALWTDKDVTATGPRFELENAVCTLKPLQRPHPPIWIAANADAAIARAARWNLPWNINAHSRYELVARQVELYCAAARGAGRNEQPTFPMSREMYCGRTREEAFAVAKPYLAGKYQAYDDWGQDKVMPGNEEFDIPFERLAVDRFVLGDPDDCASEIERYRALGVDRLHLRMNWPGMPLDVALDGMHRFAAEVLPRFQTR